MVCFENKQKWQKPWSVNCSKPHCRVFGIFVDRSNVGLCFAVERYLILQVWHGLLLTVIQKEVGSLMVISLQYYCTFWCFCLLFCYIDQLLLRNKCFTPDTGRLSRDLMIIQSIYIYWDFVSAFNQKVNSRECTSV